MATPAQLMESVSNATGVPLATVVDIDRRLVAAGLRTKGGRGFSVARMTPLDAARLLTAILGSPFAKTSAEAVARYARTRVDDQRSREGLYASLGVPELAALAERHSFIDALAALLKALAVGSLTTDALAPNPTSKPRIEVFAFTRATAGRLKLYDFPTNRSATVEYALPHARRARSRDGKGAAAENTGDLEQSRRVTERTLLAIATLLSEESGDE